MSKTLTVKLDEKEIGLLERIRRDLNAHSAEVGQGEMYRENEVELLLAHIIRDYASSKGLYQWQ